MSRPLPRRTRLDVAVSALLAVLTFLIAPASAEPPVPALSVSPAATGAANPLADRPWGVYTGGADGVYPAWQAASGDRKRLLAKVALRPRVRWMGSWIPARDIASKVNDYIDTTQKEAGTDDVLVQMAVFMLWPEGEVNYRKALPDGYPAYYRSWVDNAARAIGDARVAMVLEPDLGITRKDGIWRPAVRWEMTEYAAKVFGALPNTHVYLDASSADWLRVDVARDMLLASGIRHVRGFALGATHYTALGDELEYGRELVAALADKGVTGKHFVVDTADNGRPFTWLQYWAKHPHGDFNNAETCRTKRERRCDTLGIPPTADVADPAWGLSAERRQIAEKWVDAYLWFGRPWLYRQASPFDLERTLQVARTTPW
jgi:hypothetical protein